MIKLAFLFFVALYVTKCNNLAWEVLTYDPTGCTKQIFYASQMQGFFYLLNCQGDVLKYTIGTGELESIHSLLDGNYFKDGGYSLAYSGDVDSLFVSTMTSNALWSYNLNQVEADAWILRAQAGSLPFYLTSLLPYMSSQSFQILAGDRGGYVVVYDPFTFGLGTFTSRFSCGETTEVLVTEINAPGLKTTSYFSLHKEGCILYYQGYQGGRGVNDAISLASSGFLDDLQFQVYRYSNRLYALWTGKVSSGRTKVCIWSFESYVQVEIPSNRASSMVIAQRTAFDDVVIVGTEEGDFYYFSLTDYVKSNNLITPIPIVIPSAPSLGAVYRIVSTYATTNMRNDGTIDYVFITLRDNGIVQLYSFNDQNWILLGTPANWKRSSSVPGPFSNIKTSDGIMMLNLDEQYYGTLLISWYGGIFKLEDLEDNLHFTRYDTGLDSNTYSRHVNLNSLMSSSSPSFKALGKPEVSTYSFFSYDQVKSFIENDSAIKITLADIPSAPTVTLIMIIEGFETNTHPSRSDLNKVKVILNKDLSNELRQVLYYTDLFKYTYNNKVLQWVTSEIVN
jgi:hypothetical protein